MLCDFFSEDTIITGLLVSHLCEDATFVYDADFAADKQKVHSGENEYHKKVLFLVGQSRKSSRYWPGEENHCSKFLCTFSNSLGLAPRATPSHAFQKKPRCEAACVLCQRKDFNENRLAGCSPRPRPQTCAGSPPVDPSWTCGCTAQLTHHKATPRRLQLGHCFCSRLAEGEERPFWESALATTTRPARLDTSLRSAIARGTPNKRRPG